MNKLIKSALLIVLVASSIQPAFASGASKPIASDRPTVVSFTMSPDTINAASANTLVSFKLVVSNPSGIQSIQTRVTLTDGISSTFSAQLMRTDTPVQKSLSTVTFQGSLTLPSSAQSGAYWATANPVASLNPDGTDGISTDTLKVTSTSKVVGAENALLVRTGADLNYGYATFQGPSYDKTLGTVFVNPKFNTVADPIWKVGESFDPTNYYELNVPNLSLKVNVKTPSVCTSDGSKLKFITEGACSYSVYTEKTSDYKLYEDSRTATITTARTKPSYVVESIATQSSTSLPLTIPGPSVFGIDGFIIPIAATPSVCSPSGLYITIISGGTCTLTYSTPATSLFLASDVYSLTFQITRAAQSVSFLAPASANLASKSLALSATSSSGASVTFQSTTPSICSVTGNSLNLLTPGACVVTATQIGSATIAPASITQTIVLTGSVVKKTVAKTVVCIKGGRSKTFSGIKCPVGYKAKK